MLDELAAAYGITRHYESADGRWRSAPDHSVRAALRVMGVACDTQADVDAALRTAQEAPWRRLVPSTTVVRNSAPPAVTLRVPPGAHVLVDITTEDGESVRAGGDGHPTGARTTLDDGTERAEVRLTLPDGLPLGYHSITVTVDGTGERATGHLVVVPDRCPDATRHGRVWGWMLQQYALRSERSWGIGDLGDLAELLRWSGSLGADFAVVNPLHAAAPAIPYADSPYYPSSRLFHEPLAIDIAAVPEIVGLDGQAARRVAELAERARPSDPGAQIDRDEVVAAKLAALAIGFDTMSRARREAFAAWRVARGTALERFATFCAIAEVHGLPFQEWPEALRRPDTEGVPAFRDAHADRISFHAYLQMLCDEQLAVVQRTAKESGARIGVIHDLAVGVDKGGADAWAGQDSLGLGVSVGAPPDAFNQQGQDWLQPPLLPNRLAEQGYAPFRDILRAVLAHAGGVRIDHVIGLFRLFWIPEGSPPTDGVYVQYPAEDLLGILALEAQRADAIVVGEDLGTVPSEARTMLADRGILTSSILYFERLHNGYLRPPDAYPVGSLASVTTHDLPTAAGWWADEDVTVRARLGIFGAETSEEAERVRKAEERRGMQEHLRAFGLLGDDPDDAARVRAMYGLLARTPAALVAVSLPDTVGDLRPPNVPGTIDEYPNWRLPVTEPVDWTHRGVTLERLQQHPGVDGILTALRDNGRPAHPTRSS